MCWGCLNFVQCHKFSGHQIYIYIYAYVCVTYYKVRDLRGAIAINLWVARRLADDARNLAMIYGFPCAFSLHTHALTRFETTSRLWVLSLTYVKGHCNCQTATGQIARDRQRKFKLTRSIAKYSLILKRDSLKFANKILCLSAQQLLSIAFLRHNLYLTVVWVMKSFLKISPIFRI